MRIIHNGLRNVAGHKEYHLHLLPKRHERAKTVATSIKTPKTQESQSLLFMWFQNLKQTSKIILDSVLIKIIWN